MRYFALLFILALSVSCKAPEPTPIQWNQWVTQHVHRFKDEEMGVVCWVYNGGSYQGGIDCLPISETRLGE